MNPHDAKLAIADRTRLTTKGLDRLTSILIDEPKSRSPNKAQAVAMVLRAAKEKEIPEAQLSRIIFAESQTEAEDAAMIAIGKQPEFRRGRGKPSRFEAMRLHAIGPNPRQEGTRAWHSMNIVIENPGITFEEFKKRGGNTRDLRHDCDKGHIRLEDRGS